MLGLEKIPQQRHNQKNIQINQYNNSIFIPQKKRKNTEREKLNGKLTASKEGRN